MSAKELVDLSHVKAEFNQGLAGVFGFIIQVIDLVCLLNDDVPVIEQVAVSAHSRKQKHFFRMGSILKSFYFAEVCDGKLTVQNTSFVVLNYVSQICQISQLEFALIHHEILNKSVIFTSFL
jgi:hypothetical protein